MNRYQITISDGTRQCKNMEFHASKPGVAVNRAIDYVQRYFKLKVNQTCTVSCFNLGKVVKNAPKNENV